MSKKTLAFLKTAKAVESNALIPMNSSIETILTFADTETTKAYLAKHDIKTFELEDHAIEGAHLVESPNGTDRICICLTAKLDGQTATLYKILSLDGESSFEPTNKFFNGLLRQAGLEGSEEDDLQVMLENFKKVSGLSKKFTIWRFETAKGFEDVTDPETINKYCEKLGISSAADPIEELRERI